MVAHGNRLVRPGIRHRRELLAVAAMITVSGGLFDLPVVDDQLHHVAARHIGHEGRIHRRRHPTSAAALPAGRETNDQA